MKLEFGSNCRVDFLEACTLKWCRGRFVTRERFIWGSMKIERLPTLALNSPEFFLMPFAKEHLVATCVLHLDEVSLHTARAVKW